MSLENGIDDGWFDEIIGKIRGDGFYQEDDDVC